jgi:transcriptional regulator with XRE-family HTH domain
MLAEGKQEMKMKYPNRVRELREAERWSQRELAARVGISHAEIHKIEVGNRQLKQEHINKFRPVFGVSADELIGLPPRPDGGRRSDLSRIVGALDRMERLLVDIHETVKIRPS